MCVCRVLENLRIVSKIYLFCYSDVLQTFIRKRKYELFFENLKFSQTTWYCLTCMNTEAAHQPLSMIQKNFFTRGLISVASHRRLLCGSQSGLSGWQIRVRRRLARLCSFSIPVYLAIFREVGALQLITVYAYLYSSRYPQPRKINCNGFAKILTGLC